MTSRSATVRLVDLVAGGEREVTVEYLWEQGPGLDETRPVLHHAMTYVCGVPAGVVDFACASRETLREWIPEGETAARRETLAMGYPGGGRITIAGRLYAHDVHDETTVAELLSRQAPEIGPTGVGAYRLGLTVAQLGALPAIRHGEAGGLNPEAPGVHLRLRDGVLCAIDVDYPAAHTAEGLRVGDQLGRYEAAYGPRHQASDGRLGFARAPWLETTTLGPPDARNATTAVASLIVGHCAS